MGLYDQGSHVFPDDEFLAVIHRNLMSSGGDTTRSVAERIGAAVRAYLGVREEWAVQSKTFVGGEWDGRIERVESEAEAARFLAIDEYNRRLRSRKGDDPQYRMLRRNVAGWVEV